MPQEASKTPQEASGVLQDRFSFDFSLQEPAPSCKIHPENYREAENTSSRKYIQRPKQKKEPGQKPKKRTRAKRRKKTMGPHGLWFFFRLLALVLRTPNMLAQHWGSYLALRICFGHLAAGPLKPIIETVIKSNLSPCSESKPCY